MLFDLDTINEQMESRFAESTYNTILVLIPSAVVAPKWRYATGNATWEYHAKQAAMLYEDDMANPELLSSELLEWKSIW